MLTVIGCDGRPMTIPATATLIVGGARHLPPSDVEQIVLGPLAPAIDRIKAHDGHVVVLASGDPGFFGIVRALRAAGLEPTVVPAVSSVAAAFARAGLTWEDAIVVSAHGRDRRRAVNVCRAFPKVAVLTGPGCGPEDLRELLPGRTLLVAERLGMPDERVSIMPGSACASHQECGQDGSPQQWQDPNVVLVIDQPDGNDPARWIAGTQPGPHRWALGEEAYEHRDSMITKAEVRAYVLARLGPRVGDLIWDIGAGSGSVSAECARFGAAVIAVERDPDAIGFIERNTSGLGVQIVQSAAPECLAELPDADAVFVGGGGPDVLAACLARNPQRLVTTFAAVERVGPAMELLSQAGYAVEGVQLQASRLSMLPGGGHRLAAINPVFVVSGVLP